MDFVFCIDSVEPHVLEIMSLLQIMDVRGKFVYLGRAWHGVVLPGSTANNDDDNDNFVKTPSIDREYLSSKETSPYDLQIALIKLHQRSGVWSSIPVQQRSDIGHLGGGSYERQMARSIVV